MDRLRSIRLSKLSKWAPSALMIAIILVGQHPMTARLQTGLLLLTIAVLIDEIARWPPVAVLFRGILSIVRLAYYTLVVFSFLYACYRLTTEPLLLSHLCSDGSAHESQALDRLLLVCHTPDVSSADLKPFNGLANKVPKLNEALRSWYDQLHLSCGVGGVKLMSLDLRPPSARLAALHGPTSVMLETIHDFDRRLITVTTGRGRSHVLLDSADHASLVFAGVTLLNVTRTIEDGKAFFDLVLKHIDCAEQISA